MAYFNDWLLCGKYLNFRFVYDTNDVHILGSQSQQNCSMVGRSVEKVRLKQKMILEEKSFTDTRYMYIIVCVHGGGKDQDLVVSWMKSWMLLAMEREKKEKINIKHIFE